MIIELIVLVLSIVILSSTLAWVMSYTLIELAKRNDDKKKTQGLTSDKE